MKQETWFCDLCGVKSEFGSLGVTRVVIEYTYGITRYELCQKCLEYLEVALKAKR